MAESSVWKTSCLTVRDSSWSYPSTQRTSVNAPKQKLLVVDDEAQILRALKSILTKTYDVQVAASGEEALQFAAENPPDLVILDLSLPGISGLEVTRTLREWLKAPILILSVRDTEADKICALDLGADDYLTKPFLAGELLARTRALLRRGEQGRAKPGEVRSGNLVVDLASRTATKAGVSVRLTRTEFALLATLAANADTVVTSRALARSVWAEKEPDDIRALRVHISNLRSKIEADPSLPQHIVTEPGLGYRFLTEDVWSRSELSSGLLQPRQSTDALLYDREQADDQG